MNIKKKNIILLGLLTIVIIFFVVKDDFDDIFKVLTNINMYYFIISVIFLILFDFFKSLSLHNLIKISNEKVKLIDSYKLNLLSHFFNNVTPFSSGAQPYQIYYLNKFLNVKYSNGFAIIILNFFFFQISFCLIATIFLLLNLLFNFIVVDLFVFKIILIGYFVNIFVLMFLIYLIKRQKRYFSKKLLNLLLKYKLIKEETIDKFLKNINGFYLYLHENKTKNFKKIFIYNLLSMIFFLLLSFFVLKSINIADLNIMKVMTAQTFVILVCAFVPIPGGSLGFELGYLTFFSGFGSSYLIKSSMLLWRFLTYYLLTVIGSIVFIFKKEDLK